MAVSGHSSPLVDTSCSVDLVGLRFLKNKKPTQVLPAREEVFKPPVIAHDAVDDPSAGAHDLGRQQNDCM